MPDYYNPFSMHVSNNEQIELKLKYFIYLNRNYVANVAISMFR